MYVCATYAKMLISADSMGNWARASATHRLLGKKVPADSRRHAMPAAPAEAPPLSRHFSALVSAALNH